MRGGENARRRGEAERRNAEEDRRRGKERREDRSVWRLLAEEQEVRAGRRRTNRRDDEEDEEGVEDGHDGGGEGRHDVAEGAEPAEEADDAQGTDGPQHVDGHGDRAQGDEGEGDNDGVEDVPAVAHEGREPVGVGVYEQLGGEDGGEGGVHDLEPGAQRRELAVAADERGGELGLGRVEQEVLRNGRRRSGARRQCVQSGLRFTSMMSEAISVWKAVDC